MPLQPSKGKLDSRKKRKEKKRKEKKRKEKKRKEKKRKEKKRKQYTCQHQFDEKPSAVPGCPVAGQYNCWCVIRTTHRCAFYKRWLHVHYYYYCCCLDQTLNPKPASIGFLLSNMLRQHCHTSICLEQIIVYCICM